jgi:preprotein translocase subunit SecD
MLQFSRFRIFTVFAAILVTLGLLAPSLLPNSTVKTMPQAWQDFKIVLGLDLQGGSHVLLEVDKATVKKDMNENLRDDVRKILRDNNLQHQGIQIVGDSVQFRLREGQDIAKATTEMRKLITPDAQGQPTLDVKRADDGLVTLANTENGVKSKLGSAVDRSIEIIRRRIDALGATEPNIQRQGIDRVLVQVPGLDDPERLKTILGQTAKLSFRMVDTSIPIEQALSGRVPADSEILYENEAGTRQPLLIQKRVIVSGEELVDAQAGFENTTKQPIVSFRFNANGGRKFAQVTQENVGRPFAIVLDNKVVSAPVIRDAILTGSGQISGNFTLEQVKDLALLLRSGALPAPLNIIEQRVVGASLGQDSIKAGTSAAIISSILVLVFMVVVYRTLGIFANLAVILNVSMIFALMALFGATLTLPGIAGIVLTVGMAVDSNVLVYERIREEYRAGRGVLSSLDTGFKMAFGTILDANLTGLIAAVILFFLGSGPVRGFALTLALGILTTLFTAITFTRFLVILWVRYAKPTKITL